jgi:hypothetical protein
MNREFRERPAILGCRKLIRDFFFRPMRSEVYFSSTTLAVAETKMVWLDVLNTYDFHIPSSGILWYAI